MNEEEKGSSGQDYNSEFDNSEFNIDDEHGKDVQVEDPSKLIDLELVSLLKYCSKLQEQYRDSDDYQDELMSKSLELGARNKDKTVILDMDETMIAAKLGSKLPKNFHPTFCFDFGGSTISVKVRPYLHDMLEKIAQLFEIIVFTAGVKEYADPILDQLDPDGKLFKARLYRDSCIKVE